MKRPLSMTGFGRGEYRGDDVAWTVEIRSVNHRFREIKIRIPRQYSGLEERIRQEVEAYYARGRLDISVEQSGESAAGINLRVNLALAREYLNCLNILRRELPLAGAPDLGMLMTFRDIINPAGETHGPADDDREWPAIRDALVAALQNALLMREDEGRFLKKDLRERIGGFGRTVKEIESAVPGLILKREKLLKERLDNLLKGVDIDPIRLAQEVAIIVDKSDVSEELVRLGSHISQFNDLLDSAEPVGRKLDFLMQEFLREVNTLASKISDAATAHIVVDLKNELEKMREQVQNLE